MSKILTAGFVALFATVSIAATTVPAAAKGKHHGGHGGHGWSGGHGGGFGFGGIYLGGYDNPDPIYCVGKHGKLYICGWN